MSIDYGRARRSLARRDPVLRDLMRRHGPCGLASAQHDDPFKALVHAIISQQLSSRAAATIERRFDALFTGRPTPEAVAALPDERLRAVGLSTQKTRYIRDLADRVQNKSLDLDALAELPDVAVVDALTQVKGIGRWTAEIFLMFRLGRPDILPADDLGLMNAAQRIYATRKRPTPEQLRRRGETWRPYRSVAAWYLWASLSDGGG
jgi:DNA-3-methyladenine glycosylase II